MTADIYALNAFYASCLLFCSFSNLIDLHYKPSELHIFGGKCQHFCLILDSEAFFFPPRV